ncbi:hypothetical protein [Rahnella bonaserana]|jgi:hypothetical protein|uniref:hypothetical protein n=1 Tax=Rahnella bonaserana TaxID=2816248 RepID=UPI00320A7B81
MDAIMVFVSIAFAFLAIRSICLKQQNKFQKIWKSVFASWYFLVAAGAIVTPGDEATGVIMLAVGITILYFTNRKSKTAEHSKATVSIKNKTSLKTSNASHLTKNLNKRTTVKNATASDMYNVAFLYINSNGVETFRDVDIKSFDGHYIEGYCHVANNLRTFVIDRIEGDVIVRSTGESLEPYVWAEKLRAE